MGKFKMPTVRYFLKRRRIFEKRKEATWTRLKRLMRENLDKKPYNKQVHRWASFLKELRHHYFCEAKIKYERLESECGPDWYTEFSLEQRNILKNLRSEIVRDLIDQRPARVKDKLWAIGVTLHLKDELLLKIMNDCEADPGLFMWYLYERYYKKSPTELLPNYDNNSMLIMSSLVFIDLEECLQNLESLTTPKPDERELSGISDYNKKKKVRPQQNASTEDYLTKENRNKLLKTYLTKVTVPLTSPHPLTVETETKKKIIPFTLEKKEKELAEHLTDPSKRKQKTLFLELRRTRNMKTAFTERVCTYKFWEPRTNLKSLQHLPPKVAAMLVKQKMIKKKAKAKHVKYTPYENNQFLVGTVAYVNDSPVFMLNTVAILSTEYTIIHGGYIRVNDEYALKNNGYCLGLPKERNICAKECQCLQKWLNSSSLKSLSKNKCICYHNYDYNLEGKSAKDQKYFYGPTPMNKFWFDLAKIYQTDPWYDFAQACLQNELDSQTRLSTVTPPMLTANELTAKQLLELLLTDLKDTALLIPHLPQASKLKNLQAWARKKFHGSITRKEHKRLLNKTQRRWADLSHIDFRARAYVIPFTFEQLHNMNWSHRGMIQKIFKILLDNFETRTRIMQSTQSRLWWPTMEYYRYPQKSFLDAFNTFMPARYRDTLVLNPYVG